MMDVLCLFPRVSSKLNCQLLLSLSLTTQLIMSTTAYAESSVAESAIVTVDKSIKPIQEFPDVLDQTIRKIHASSKYDNFILFVHGRGDHPEKAFKKALIKNLEKNYSAKVIMFHWPSKSKPWEFPEEKARASGKDLMTVIEGIKNYKRNHPEDTAGIKFSLLTHSMGSLVLEEALGYSSLQQNEIIFDTIMINSAASSAQTHAAWIEKITFSDQVFISINQNDSILRAAGVLLGDKRLGKGLTSELGNDFDLANNSKYIEVSNSELNHRYYLYNDVKKYPHIMDFFTQVLNGIPPRLDEEAGIERVDRGQIYVFRPLELTY
ncbi:MAG: alpha/beta hydrolase [Bdellovibrionota bacterium]